jgi:prophage regulatory protein
MSCMILRLPTVKLRTGLSRSTIYLRVAQGSFPKPISLGARAIGWVESEIEGWLEGQLAKSRPAADEAARPRATGGAR